MLDLLITHQPNGIHFDAPTANALNGRATKATNKPSPRR
jgi:hypothetical protein